MAREESSEIVDCLRLVSEPALDHSPVEKGVGLVPPRLLQCLAQEEKPPRLGQFMQPCDVPGRERGEQQ